MEPCPCEALDNLQDAVTVYLRALASKDAEIDRLRMELDAIKVAANTGTMLTLPELASRIGAKNQTVHNWWTRYRDTPRPRLRGLYDLEEWVQWFEKTGRTQYAERLKSGQ